MYATFILWYQSGCVRIWIGQCFNDAMVHSYYTMSTKCRLHSKSNFLIFNFVDRGFGFLAKDWIYNFRSSASELNKQGNYLLWALHHPYTILGMFCSLNVINLLNWNQTLQSFLTIKSACKLRFYTCEAVFSHHPFNLEKRSAYNLEWLQRFYLLIHK